MQIIQGNVVSEWWRGYFTIFLCLREREKKVFYCDVRMLLFRPLCFLWLTNFLLQTFITYYTIQCVLLAMFIIHVIFNLFSMSIHCELSCFCTVHIWENAHTNMHNEPIVLGMVHQSFTNHHAVFMCGYLFHGTHKKKKNIHAVLFYSC